MPSLYRRIPCRLWRRDGGCHLCLDMKRAYRIRLRSALATIAQPLGGSLDKALRTLPSAELAPIIKAVEKSCARDDAR